MNDFRFPGSDQHTAVVGRTGSGKTQFGAWLLSESDLDMRPHIVVDFKRDPLLNSVPEAVHIKHDKVPTKPGLYVVHFLQHMQDEMDNFFWQVWSNENTHLHIDESYIIDRNSKAFNALLTQGRSKNVNLTCLSQRPAFCSRFVFSEASYISVFHLNDVRDHKIIEGFMPTDLSETLPEYNSKWYDVKRNEIFNLLPVPDGNTILARFSERLKPRRRFI